MFGGFKSLVKPISIDLSISENDLKDVRAKVQKDVGLPSIKSKLSLIPSSLNKSRLRKEADKYKNMGEGKLRDEAHKYKGMGEERFKKEADGLKNQAESYKRKAEDKYNKEADTLRNKAENYKKKAESYKKRAENRYDEEANALRNKAEAYKNKAESYKRKAESYKNKGEKRLRDEYANIQDRAQYLKENGKSRLMRELSDYKKKGKQELNDFLLKQKKEKEAFFNKMIKNQKNKFDEAIKPYGDDYKTLKDKYAHLIEDPNLLANKITQGATSQIKSVSKKLYLKIKSKNINREKKLKKKIRHLKRLIREDKIRKYLPQDQLQGLNHHNKFQLPTLAERGQIFQYPNQGAMPMLFQSPQNGYSQGPTGYQGQGTNRNMRSLPSKKTRYNKLRLYTHCIIGFSRLQKQIIQKSEEKFKKIESFYVDKMNQAIDQTVSFVFNSISSYLKEITSEDKKYDFEPVQLNNPTQRNALFVSDKFPFFKRINP